MIEPTEEFPTKTGLYWWHYMGSRIWVLLTIYADDASALWVRDPNGGEVPLQNWTKGVWFDGEDPPTVGRPA